LGNFDPTTFYLSKFKLLEVALSLRKSVKQEEVKKVQVLNLNLNFARFLIPNLDLNCDGSAFSERTFFSFS